ncbi:MAG: glycosyltransferase family 4 protein [Bacteroidota bacterium]|nr:glycosyltransferase family 4 protein [Bacteroidota bacterium]
MIKAKDIKVVIIAGTLAQGGAERQIYYIASELKKNGNDVNLISLSKGEYWESKIEQIGIQVHYAGKNASKWRRLLNIIKLIRTIKPDIIQSMHFYTNLYANIAGRILGIKSIAASRNNLPLEISSSGLLGKLSFKLPKYLAANSPPSVKAAIQLGKDAANVFYLPNAIDTDVFKPVPKPVQTQKYSILTIGRLTGQKRVDRFIDLIGDLKEAGYKIQATIVGDGEELSRLQDYAHSLMLPQDKITFAGLQPDTQPYYHIADIFVLTSDYEGTPNVVLEAMASGIPVVCTNVGMLSEIIQDGKNGYLVEANDRKALFNKVAHLLGEENLRLKIGQAGRDFVAHSFSKDSLIGNLMGIYKKVLND